MLLDNGYRFRPGQDGVPSLDELRADLVAVFPSSDPFGRDAARQLAQVN
jgi:hypothetical protein